MTGDPVTFKDIKSGSYFFSTITYRYDVKLSFVKRYFFFYSFDHRFGQLTHGLIVDDIYDINLALFVIIVFMILIFVFYLDIV